jgi:hypothetical protein
MSPHMVATGRSPNVNWGFWLLTTTGYRYSSLISLDSCLGTFPWLISILIPVGIGQGRAHASSC